MEVVATAVAACLASSAIGVLAAVFAAPRQGQSIGDRAAGFAVGVLLGAALFEIVPHAIDHFDSGGEAALLLAFAGMCVVILNRTCYCRNNASGVGPDCAGHESRRSGRRAAEQRMLVAGDLTHSLVDGSLIAVAFATNFTFGLLTATAVALHELPRRVAIVCVLARLGLARRRVIGLSLLAALATATGGAAAAASIDSMGMLVPVLLVVAAIMMTYVAMTQLARLLAVGHGSSLAGRTAGHVALGVFAVLAAHQIFETLTATTQ